MMRVGIGSDFHRFAAGRRLVLGGVVIEHHQGLEGHSDADVLLHAICDSLLGAAGLGDIGIHFPSSDPQYKNISSLVLLKRVQAMIASAGFGIGNIDTMILAEEPVLMAHFGAMRERIASELDISIEQVNIKATRAEGLGPIGRGEGMMAQAVAIIYKK